MACVTVSGRRQLVAGAPLMAPHQVTVTLYSPCWNPPNIAKLTIPAKDKVFAKLQCRFATIH